MLESWIEQLNKRAKYNLSLSSTNKLSGRNGGFGQGGVSMPVRQRTLLEYPIDSEQFLGQSNHHWADEKLSWAYDDEASEGGGAK